MKYEKGQAVNYHAIIGGAVTSGPHIVQHCETWELGGNVYWIEGKAGCVAEEALSAAPVEATDEPTPREISDNWDEYVGSKGWSDEPWLAHDHGYRAGYRAARSQPHKEDG